MADAKIREIDPYQRLFGESYDEGSGYDLPKLAETRSEIDDLEAELEGRIGRDRFASFMDQVIDDPSEAMRMLYRDGATASALNTAQSLAAAWQRALGATERYDDETAGLIEERKAEAATLVNTDMQAVTTVRMSDGSRAYVVGGQFTASEDGTVDVGASMSGSPTGGMVILLDTETGERRQASVDDIAAVESSTPAEEYLWQVEDGVTRQRDAELQQAIASAMQPREQAQGEAAPVQSSEIQTRAEGGAAVSGTGSVSESGIENGLKFRDGDGNVFTYDGTEEDGLERFIYDESGEVIFLRPELVGNASVGLVPVEETEEGAGLSPETSVEVRDSDGAGQEAGVSSDEGESVATGTALSQIPVDENGKPRFSDADPELAWDALVERTQDEEIAQAYADNMVASRESALEKAEKAKPKANDDLEAFVESERQRKDAISASRRELEAWRRIAGVAQSRKDAREEEVRRIMETEAQSEPMQQETVPPVAEREEPATTGPETSPVETPLQQGIMETEGKEGTPMQENTPSEGPKPVGRGVFGDIYDQFKGKVKEAVAFLLRHKEGDLLAVFNRPDIGDIDLVWGSAEKNMGLAHIIDKHVGPGKDFNSVEDAVSHIERVIENGTIIQDGNLRYVISEDGFRVAIRKDIDGVKKNWIVTALDYNKSKEEKGITTNPTSASHGEEGSEPAVPRNSGDKGMESSDNLQVETQEKIETESNGQAKSASESGEFAHLTDEVSKMEPQESEMETVSEKRSGASDALSSLERAGLGESDVAGELRRIAAAGEEKSQEASSEEYQAGQERKRQDTGNQEKVDKKREESGPVEKIEDVGEKTDDGKRVLFQQTDETLNNDSEARELATGAVLEALNQAGIDVEVATPEMVEEVLGRDEARLSTKRKTSLETALPEDESSFKGTVISSDDGAKVLKNLDKLAKDYEEKRLAAENVFVGEVAKALGMTDKGKSSQYATFEAKNGKVITIRLSNHNATVSNFDNRGETEGLSIVISRKPNQGVTNDGTSHVVEYFYPDKRLRNAEGNPLAEIVRSLQQALYSGEYQDNTGLAERQEVNGEDHIELMQTPGGRVYGWTVGGKIYLTESGLNPNTPVHEYTHLWAEAMRRRNPKGWASVKDLLRGTPVWQEVLEDENYSSIRDNEDEVASEALSRLSGRENARKLEREAERILDSNAGMPDKVSSLALLGRMREALKRFWRWAGKNLFGIDRFRSIDEVTDRVLYDLVSGTDLRTGDLRESMDAVNERFNEQLAGLTEENADGVTLDLGRPSETLRAAGVEDKPMKLYGNKVIKKMKKHGFGLSELRDLPRAVANPIAVFNNYGKDGSRAILTELRTAQGNFLVTLDLGKDADIDFNIVTSVFGKGDSNIVDWINKGRATYINKEKALAFLSHQSAPIAATAANEELSSAAKVIENFENPSIGGEKNVNGPESEEESIVRRSKEDGSYMKAPNGAPTRLNERQWVQVRTKAFKDWFGDWESDPENSSKVVDENGEPLVVYHGTISGFTFFEHRNGIRDGFYFSDSVELSRKFAGPNGHVLECFLNMRDPNRGGFDGSGAEMSRPQPWSHRDGGIFIKRQSDRYAEKGTREFIVFNPNQIKSATDNTGSFSESSDDIRFSIVSEAASSLRDEVDGVGDDAEKLKVVRRRMADFVGRHLTSEAGKEMYKSEIMRLIRQVSNARSADEAEMYLRRLKTVMNRAELREATRGLERLTHQRMTTKTDKGVRRGRLVDDRTRGLIEGIRETLGELMATGVDEDLRGLRKELKSLKPEEGMSGDALADLESRRASLTIEIRDLEERRDALRRGNLEETSKAVDEAISELEDEFTERGYLVESKQSRYERLLMKRRYIDVREGLSGLSETEARQKSAAEELTSLRSQLREEQSRGDEDAVSATLAEMARVRGLQPAFSVARIWNVNKNPIT